MNRAQAAPSLIWSNFNALWSADLPALRQMEAHLLAKIPNERPGLDRMGTQMALMSVQREIAAKERARALANPT